MSYVASCTDQRRRLVHVLECLERGNRLFEYDVNTGGRIDTTQEFVARLKSRIAYFDRAIVEFA